LRLAIPRKRSDDIVLAAHEASANAVEHSSGDTWEISATSNHGGIDIAVTSHGPFTLPHAPPKRPSDGQRGRGLSLIRSLADDVTLITTDGEFHQRLTLHFDDQPAA
jgi:anti-sigma regulatory factor (Ser/Thr protein kinase)